MPNSEAPSSEIAQLNRVITYINIMILLSKAIPWIVIGLATWSLSLGIIDFMQKNWVWAVINFALALGGYSFAIGIFRKGHNRDHTRAVKRTYVQEHAASREPAEAA